MEFIVNVFLNSLLNIAALTLATMGITLIFKTSYTTNFAQGSIAAFCGYIAAVLMGKHGMSVWATLAAAVAIGFILAALVDIVLFRRGRAVNALSKQIITMGLVIMISAAIPMIFGAADISVNMVFFGGVWRFSLFGKSFSVIIDAVFCFLLAAAVLTTIFVLLKYSKWGLSVRATAANEYVAQMMGINTKRVTALTWGIAGALGAVCGIMLLTLTTQMNAGYMVGTQVDAFMSGILGGMNTFAGPVLGAVIISLLRFIFIYYFSEWANVCIYAIILLIVLIRPMGLLGKKTVIKV